MDRQSKSEFTWIGKLTTTAVSYTIKTTHKLKIFVHAVGEANHISGYALTGTERRKESTCIVFNL